MKATWVLAFCLLVVACDESVLVEPNPPVVIQPKVELTITPDAGVVLPYGSNITISWVSTDAKSVILNNKTVGTSGSITVQLFQDTKYSVVAINGSFSSLPIEKSITMGDWTTSDLGLITYSYWMLKTAKYIQDGVVVQNVTLVDEEKTLHMQLKLDNKIYANGVFSSNWSFGTTGHLLMNGWEEDYSVTKNELVISYPALYNSKPAIIELTYGRSISQ